MQTKHQNTIASSHYTVQFEIRMRNYGVAPFYYPLSLNIHSASDEESWFVADMGTVLPEESSVFTLSLENISVGKLHAGFSMQLQSEWLFEERPIQWANAGQNNGILTIETAFVCELLGETFSLGEVVETTERCVCDVDGEWYTLTGDICSNELD